MWDTIPPSAWKNWEQKREKPVRKASLLTAMLCTFVEKWMWSNRFPCHCWMTASFDCVLLCWRGTDLFIGRISAAWKNRSDHYAKAARADLALLSLPLVASDGRWNWQMLDKRLRVRILAAIVFPAASYPQWGGMHANVSCRILVYNCWKLWVHNANDVCCRLFLSRCWYQRATRKWRS
jgi:hypothetical protein